jgi:hypothetical protein
VLVGGSQSGPGFVVAGTSSTDSSDSATATTPGTSPSITVAYGLPTAGGGAGGGTSSAIAQWVIANGTLIEASAYGGSSGGQSLYYIGD